MTKTISLNKKFISFEGGEGTGKSTQVRLLSEYLNSEAEANIVTREPGGSEGAEEIRKLIVEGNDDKWGDLTESLLFYAARSDHIEKTIIPALEQGSFVLCDRYNDSSHAYQGVAGTVPVKFLELLDNYVVGEITPALTFILDVDPEIGLKRSFNRWQSFENMETRFEKKPLDYHKKLREYFLNLGESERCVIINADDDIENIQNKIAKDVSKRYNI